MQKPIAALALLALLFVPVQTQALQADELLALVAMPLAVAAASEVTGIPVDDLSTLVATLNAADVPPVQIVEVVRYAPVALVIEEPQPVFVPFVQTQFSQGVTGTALVTVIEERLRTVYDVTPQIVTPPQTVVVVQDNFIPAIVATRIAAHRAHPHGGPPGQVKKQLGLKTGAEVVHGSKKTRVVSPQPVVVTQQPVVVNQSAAKVDNKPKQNKGHENKGGGQGKGNDKGKGKGKNS